MSHRLLFAGVSMAVVASLVLAGENAAKSTGIDVLKNPDYSVKSITPIFGQLVMFSYPRGFKPVFENVTGGQYLQESVLEGETTKKWSQMITVTGAQGLSANPNATPEKLADRIAGGFRRACPDSFSGTSLGAARLSGHESFGAIISCGMAAPAGAQYSESMLLIVLKGESDYYTIQWAERADASRTPLKLDETKWADRMKRLAPIRLCPIVRGEPAPYPSCANRK